MSSIRVLSGDFLPGDAQFAGGSLFLRTAVSRVLGECLPLSQVTAITFEQQGGEKSIRRAVGWAVAGGALLGAVGAAAGLLAGGNKTIVNFTVRFRDGRKLFASAEQKVFNALQARVFNASS